MRVQKPEDLLFRNTRGAPLTRDGAAYLLRKYVRIAAQQAPVLRKRRVTPHVMRHSCAVALLQAGIDVSVIRDYLGHASVATTSRYITTNLQMKRDVLEAFWKRAGLDPSAPRKWRPSPKLLAFLESL
jgi:site-specific recombinase XerD